MRAAAVPDFEDVVARFEEHGILMESDPRLPSVAVLVAGEPVRGSWWGHPRGHAIFNVLGRLDDHPDACVVKLISGKVTFVHRAVWPAMLAVARERGAWQVRGLPAEARKLLAIVDEAGGLRTDQLGARSGGSARAEKAGWGQAARDLEGRLLVHSEQIHSESGAHAKRLETWERWARRTRVGPVKMSALEGRNWLEAMVAGLNERFLGRGKLPWQTRSGALASLNRRPRAVRARVK